MTNPFVAHISLDEDLPKNVSSCDLRELCDFLIDLDERYGLAACKIEKITTVERARAVDFPELSRVAASAG